MGKLEDLKKKIYHKDAGRELNQRFKRERAKELKRKEKDWKKEKKGSRLPAWATIAGVAFLIFALLGIGYYQFIKFRPEKVEINLVKLDQAPGGEVVDLKAELQNNNHTALKEGNLKIEFPETTYLIEEREFKSEKNISIGKIKAGGKKSISFPVRFLHSPYEEIAIKTTLDYRAQKNFYTQKDTTKTTINSSAIKITFQKPRRLVKGQKSIYKVFYTNTSSFDLPASQIQLSLPSAFQLESADPEPVKENMWNIGPLKAKEGGTITFVGKVTTDVERLNIGVGANFQTKIKGEYRDYTEETFFQDVYPAALVVKPTINKTYARTSANESPILESRAELAKAQRLRKEINLEEVESIEAKDLDLIYKLSLEIKNTTDSVFTDIVVSSKLNGELFDAPWFETERLGEVNEAQDEIKWKIDSLSPKESDEFGVYFPLKTTLPIGEYRDKNSLIAESKITTKSPPKDWQGIKISSEAEADLKLGTEASLVSAFSGPGDPLEHLGPIPPVTQKQTSYAVAWKINNSYNSIRDVKVEATLPDRVEWRNSYTPSGENLNYNSLSNKLTWEVEQIQPGAGVLTGPHSVFFRLDLTPRKEDYGTTMKLLKGIKLEYKDTYTEEIETETKKDLKTNTRVGR